LIFCIAEELGAVFLPLYTLFLLPAACAKTFIVCRVFKLHFVFIDRATNFTRFHGETERERERERATENVRESENKAAFQLWRHAMEYRLAY